MSSERYNNRSMFRNRTELYKEFLQKKKLVTGLLQYGTPRMSYPTPDEIGDLDVQEYVWQFNDRFYKLADNVYGNSELWWIIPWFNQKPMEADYRPGEVIYIPQPLDDVLALFYKQGD